MTLHLWVNHQASDKMRKEKVLKNRKKTEEEDEFNGLGRKKDGRKKKQIQEAKKKALSDHRWQMFTGTRIDALITVAGRRYLFHNFYEEVS